MRKRKRTKKKRIRIMPLMMIVIAAALGLYYFGTLEGVIGAICGYFVLLIAFKIWRKRVRTARLRKSGIKEVDVMCGEDFERFLGDLFKRRGFKVSYTATSGDYGADLILKDGPDIIVVQAKRYSNTVGVKAVQEIVSAVRMYNATEAWVVTNNYYTRQAEKLADINDVYLIDRDELIDMILNKK